jgi:hypothetical protein
MDQIAMVTEQIEDSRRLVERLAEDGFSVTAACWGKDDDSELWQLYLISSVVDDEGIRKAYLRLHATIREMQKTGFSIDPYYQIHLVSPSEAFAKAILEAQRQGPGWPPVRYNEVTLGPSVKLVSSPHR